MSGDEKYVRRLSIANVKFVKNPLLAAVLLACAAVPAAADISTHSFANCGFPDTGQTQCYDNSATPVAGTCPQGNAGQDGDYSPSAATRRYTIHVPVAGSSVTVDNLTGLMWVSTGSNNGTTANWTNALASCEGTNFAGYSDWRLPNIKELHSIVNYGASGSPYIRADYFPNTASGIYWSSTVPPSITANALFVDFNQAGGAYHGIKTSGLYVRCVRGGPS